MTRESENDYLNNQNPINPKLIGEETKVKIVYIICAAVWFQNGEKHIHQPRNIDSGFIVYGRRHHNCFITSYILNGEVLVKNKISTGEWKVTSGFITSDDRFVDRKEAGQIDFDAKQIKKLTYCLFSEDLY